jgi:adenylate cyclase
MRQITPPAPKPRPPWMDAPSKEFFWTLPLPSFVTAARGVGYVDVPSDPDAIYRRAVPLRPVDNGFLYPHLAVMAAAVKLGVRPQEIRVSAPYEIALGRQRRVPVSEQGTILIDFAGPPPSARNPPMYPRYSYSEVLKLSPRFGGRGKEVIAGKIAPDAFRGKIVFVGATAPGLYDLRASPYSQVNVGVETNANLTNAILQRRFFVHPGPWFLMLVLASIGLGCGRLLAVQSMLRGTLITVISGLLYSLAALTLFSSAALILPMASPLVALGLCYSSVMAYRFQTEYRERLRNRAYLDLYVTRQVADRILNDPHAAELGGLRVDVSVLFSDIRGFTSMSEKMKPEEVVAILNEYFDRMVPVIMDGEGTLDKYVGDAIMGVWGAPIEQPDHARRAVRAGLGMLQELQELQVSWRERGLPAFDIGIGINSGEAVAGNIGSRKRAQYTVIGDTVNTASRLESLNKEMETHMIISEATYHLVEDLVEVRLLPPVNVKGKAESLIVYEVLRLKEATEPRTAPGVLVRSEGLAS